MLPCRAVDLLDERMERDKVHFGCPTIDKITGGISSFGISEIAGQAGSGKTQLCLYLALQCAFRGINNKTFDNVAYISCGEGMFPIKRFQQIAESFENQEYKKEPLYEAVHIKTCHTMDDALETVDKLIPEMCQNKKNIRLVIIDSIAGLVRTEYDTKNAKDMAIRTSALFKFAAKLKWLSDTYKTSILVVNQMTATGFDTNPILSIQNKGMTAVPALGLAWMHCINTRILLHKEYYSYSSDGIVVPNTVTSTLISNDDNNQKGSNRENMELKNNQTSYENAIVMKMSNDVSSPTRISDKEMSNYVIGSNKNKRKLTVLFSPSQPSGSCEFEITDHGISGVE